jgi:hypothetical protein
MAISLTSGGITSTTSLTKVVNGQTAETIDTLGNAIHNKRVGFKSNPGSTPAGGTFTSYGNSLSGNFQVGSQFNTTNGRFTAPVAGLYHFDLSAMSEGSYAHTAIGFDVNGSLAGGTCRTLVTSNFGGTHNNGSMAMTILLGQGDYVTAASGGNATGKTHAGDWCTFSGYLISAS